MDSMKDFHQLGINILKDKTFKESLKKDKLTSKERQTLLWNNSIYSKLSGQEVLLEI